MCVLSCNLDLYILHSYFWPKVGQNKSVAANLTLVAAIVTVFLSFLTIIPYEFKYKFEGL